MNSPRLLFVALHAVLLAGFSVDLLAAGDNSGLIYIPITPCRIVDTRVTGGSFAASEIRTYATNGAATQGGGSCTVYSGTTPTALSLNITVDSTSLGDPTHYGFLSLTPTPSAGSSWMNFFGGQVLANAGVATINQSNGTFAIKSQNPANVIVDVYGYFLPSLAQVGSGGSGSIVVGDTANASGQVSTAIGAMATATGQGAVAVGNYSNALAVDALSLGSMTLASGVNSTAIGAYNTASADQALALGVGTTADGFSSTTMGQDARNGNHLNSFVYGDGSSAQIPFPTTNTADRQFMVRASGGFVFYTATAPDTTTGVSLPAGGGSWASLSDRNAKDAVKPIDSRAILDAVVALPMNTWHYKTQDARYRHIGPMAQDFHLAFGVGESETSIDTVDADGIALAAIQGLNAKVDEKDKEIASLRADLAEIKHQLATLVQSQTNDGIVATTWH